MECFCCLQCQTEQTIAFNGAAFKEKWAFVSNLFYRLWLLWADIIIQTYIVVVFLSEMRLRHYLAERESGKRERDNLIWTQTFSKCTSEDIFTHWTVILQWPLFIFGTNHMNGLWFAVILFGANNNTGRDDSAWLHLGTLRCIERELRPLRWRGRLNKTGRAEMDFMFPQYSETFGWQRQRTRCMFSERLLESLQSSPPLQIFPIICCRSPHHRVSRRTSRSFSSSEIVEKVKLSPLNDSRSVQPLSVC